jgi:hypothetical protein
MIQYLENIFKNILKHGIFYLIDMYHFVIHTYDYYMRPYTKLLRQPRENDYMVCYLIFDKSTSTQTITRLEEYSHQQLMKDINDDSLIVLLSFSRTDIVSPNDKFPPSTPRNIEMDRLYCILNQETFDEYYNETTTDGKHPIWTPNLDKLRKSTTSDIMYASLKLDKDYDVYEHFKKYMIQKNKINRDVLKQMLLYYPSYPKYGTFHIMTDTFKEKSYAGEFELKFY